MHRQLLFDLLGPLAACLLAGIVAAPAGAQDGSEGSAFDQYLENVPSLGGDTPSNGAIGSPGEPLSPGAPGAPGRFGERSESGRLPWP